MAVSRFEATQGDTVRLRVVIQHNGVPFDPYDLRQVEIRRRLTATTDELVETIPASSIVREALGVYYVDWGIPTTEPIGGHVDRWFFTETSGDSEIYRDAEFTVFAQGSLSPIAGYATVDEIRSYYLPGTPLTDAEISLLIEQASDIAEAYCGRYFGGRGKTLVEDGTGAPWLVMDEIVRSITAMEVRAGGTTYALDPADFVVKGRWIIHKDFLPDADAWEGCASLCGCAFGDIFARGQQNVSVTGIFGDFENVPPRLKRAIGLLVKYGGQDGTLGGPMAYNFASESVEGHSYGLRDLAKGVGVVLAGSTGIPEVDSLLNTLRRRYGRLSVI